MLLPKDIDYAAFWNRKNVTFRGCWKCWILEPKKCDVQRVMRMQNFEEEKCDIQRMFTALRRFLVSKKCDIQRMLQIPNFKAEILWISTTVECVEYRSQKMWHPKDIECAAFRLFFLLQFIHLHHHMQDACKTHTSNLFNIHLHFYMFQKKTWDPRMSHFATTQKFSNL